MSDTPRATSERAAWLADRELVQRVARGESAAVGQFVERMRCIPRILAVQNRRSGAPLSPEDLADLAQEVFSAVWDRLERFQGEAALESWVYRFCVLMTMDAKRRRGRRGLVLTAEEPALEGADAERVNEESAEWHALDFEHLYAALERLDEKDAAVVQLKQFEGLTFEEIGGELDISPNTAKTRYYRGIDQLRTLLSPGLGGGAG